MSADFDNPSPATPASMNATLRVAAVSLGAAIAILLLKAYAWHLTGSVALMADAMESTVNVVAAAAALIALRIARMPADQGHPFGHGKAEYFSAGFEGALIAVAAGAILWQSGLRLGSPGPLTELGLGAAISVVAAVANGVLGLWLVRRGRELRSPALQADGRHVLADVITSAGALVGLGLAWATGWWVLDPIFGMLVAVNVLREGAHVVQDSVEGLMDAALPEAELQQINTILEEQLASGPALQAHDLRTRRAAEKVFIDFHLVVPGSMRVDESHEICDRVEAALEEAFEGALISIHVEPEHEAQTDSLELSP